MNRDTLESSVYQIKSMKYSDKAARIRQIQEDLGIDTNLEFAEVCGLKTTNMTNILSGMRLSIETLRDICKATNADPWYIIEGEGPRYRVRTSEPTIQSISAEIERLSAPERLEIATRILEGLGGDLVG